MQDSALCNICLFFYIPDFAHFLLCNNQTCALIIIRYRAKLAIQDESGRINLEAFDHVLLHVATVNPKKPVCRFLA
jgi:hypothetical protein